MSFILLMLGGQGFTVFETTFTTDRMTETIYTTFYETTYNTNKATDTVYLTNHLTNTNKNTVTLFQTQTIYGTNYPTQRGTNFITNFSTNTIYETYYYVQTYWYTDYTQITTFSASTDVPNNKGDNGLRFSYGYGYDFVVALYNFYFERYFGVNLSPAEPNWWFSEMENWVYNVYLPAGFSMEAAQAESMRLLEVDVFVPGEGAFPTQYSVPTAVPVQTNFSTQYISVTNRNTTTVFQTDFITYFETFYAGYTSHLTGTSRNTTTIYDTQTIYNTNKSTTTIYTTTIETNHITNHLTNTIFVTTFVTQRFTGVDKPVNNTQP